MRYSIKKCSVLLLALLFVIVGCSGKKDETAWNENNQSNKSEISEVTEPDKSAEASDYKVTFVELGSVNCVPCKMMQPIMKEIEEEYKDEVKVVFHDVWTPAGKPYAQKYRIRLIPTQVFLDKNGKEYFRHEGYFPKKDLVKVLRQKGVK